MKRLFLTLLVMFLGVFSLSISGGGTQSKLDKDIYYNDLPNINKYDLFSDEEIIEISDGFSFSLDGINKLSTKDDYNCSYQMKIDKLEQILKLKYCVTNDEEEIRKDSLSFEIINVDGIDYIVSRYGYEELSNLIEDNVKKCTAMTICHSGIFGFDQVKEGGSSGGGSSASSFSTALGNALGVLVGLGGLVLDGVIIGNAVGTYSGSSTTSSGHGVEKPGLDQLVFEAKLRRFASDFLTNLIESGELDYGWTDDELFDECKNACKQIVDGKIVSMEATELMRPIIILGAFVNLDRHVSYPIMAKGTENSIIFSTDKWDSLLEKHGDNGMWMLNRFFLDFWISQKCYFLLVTNPNYFYTPPFDRNLDSTLGLSYRKELKHIYSRNYRWICDLDCNNFCNCLILAD